jgi:transcriptional regulator with XRE-family HTH domain
MISPNERERPPFERQPLLRTMFGEVLRRIRLDQGRTLADVARAAKVSMPYLSELERGRKEASSEVLAAICAALGIEIADLLAEASRDLVPPVIQLDRAGYDGTGYDRTGYDRYNTGPSASFGSGDALCMVAA